MLAVSSTRSGNPWGNATNERLLGVNGAGKTTTMRMITGECHQMQCFLFKRTLVETKKSTMVISPVYFVVLHGQIAYDLCRWYNICTESTKTHCKELKGTFYESYSTRRATNQSSESLGESKLSKACFIGFFVIRSCNTNCSKGICDSSIWFNQIGSNQKRLLPSMVSRVFLLSFSTSSWFWCIANNCIIITVHGSPKHKHVCWVMVGICCLRHVFFVPLSRRYRGDKRGRACRRC